MSTTRKVTATNPHTGQVVDRQSKTKVYTHALVVHSPAREAYTIPAGTYTVPAKRVRGHNVPSYHTTFSVDDVHEARTENWGILSFHTSFEAAHKAGRAEVTQAATILDTDRAIFGDIIPNVVFRDRYEVVPVEVIDEGFNA